MGEAMSGEATYSDQSGTYVTTITAEEYRRLRLQADEVHVVARTPRGERD